MIIYRFSIPIYGIIIILSVFIGMLYIYFSLKKDNYLKKNLILYLFLYLVSSLIFGKIYTLLTSNGTNFITAGLSSYGGLIGVILSSIFFEKLLPSNQQVIKYSILSLPLVYGLSKIACFLSGCCYGIPFTSIFSVIYADGLNIPLFPIQLLETIVFLLLFMICNHFQNKKIISYVTILFCTIAKFLLDFLRYDHLKVFLTTNQIFSIFLFSFTILILFLKIRKQVIR